ncbi:hypothetical protein TKK_0019136 [Trichogramma kaykai]|uniref:CCHC-type domain-containing protein n=1 Tax=Trichogramma kaykai TaxID=54128 RepID=A0ABD2VVB2_9HYME
MFEPSDRLEQLQSELAHAYQKKGESVNDFGKRLANLVRRASDVIKTSFDDDVTQRNLIQATHKSAIKCYVNGLTEDIHHRMVVNINLATLDEAIRAAGEVETDLTIRRSLLLANKDPPTRVHAIASEEKVEAPRLCFKCMQPGHFARACQSGPSGPRDQQRPRYCNYCKREGHVYARCWKPEQAENLNSKPSHATDAGVTRPKSDDASTTKQSWQLPPQDKTTPQSYQSDVQN